MVASEVTGSETVLLAVAVSEAVIEVADEVEVGSSPVSSTSFTTYLRRRSIRYRCRSSVVYLVSERPWQ
jgi:hypothetical protein